MCSIEDIMLHLSFPDTPEYIIILPDKRDVREQYRLIVNEQKLKSQKRRPIGFATTYEKQ